ncbi:unnamed protein product, partial [Ectocarpus sp. 12 AP-2014]
SKLPPKEQATQFMAVEACLSAGVPLNALENSLMKDFLHHLGARLPGARHLANYIPFIEKKEVRPSRLAYGRILDEVGDSRYAITFDETPYRAACFGIGIRFVNKEGQITQRVLNLSMLSKSMGFKAIHGEVMKITVDEYKIDRSKCVGFMLDGCGANMKALDTLLLNFPNAVGVRCFSHLLNNCGNELSSEETDKFAGHLHVLLAHSHNARDLWLQETKVSPPKPVSHRWSSRHVRNNALVLNWQQMKTFVDKFTSTEESRSKSAAAMREELGRVRPDGVHQELILQLGFAVAVDVGIHLVRPTHLLQGDGFLVSTYPRGPYISHLPFDKVNMPNVNALVREYSNSVNANVSISGVRLWKLLVRPEIKWLREKALFDMHAERNAIRVFKAARILNFTVVKGHGVEESDVHVLAEVFPFVTTAMVHEFVVEKDLYSTAAAGTDSGCDLWAFWHDNRLKLPAWYNVAKDVALIQPSSAFMERVFSLLRACMDERQEQCLSDRITASTLLKYNRASSARS